MVRLLASISSRDSLQCSDCSSTLPPVISSSTLTRRCRTSSSNRALRRYSTLPTTIASNTTATAIPTIRRVRERRAGAFSVILLSAGNSAFRCRGQRRQWRQVLNLALLPQIVQPSVQQLVHVLLHQQLADLWLDLLQSHDLDSSFLHVGQHLVTVVRFDLLGLHMDIGPQTHFDEIHHLHLMAHVLLYL